MGTNNSDSGVKVRSGKRKNERLYSNNPSKTKKSNTRDQKEVIQEKLASAWKSLLPPVEEEGLKESWVALIYAKSKKNNQLLFGRLKNRFLYDSDGSHLELSKWDVDCCKPYRVDSRTGIVEEIPGGEKYHTVVLLTFTTSTISQAVKGRSRMRSRIIG